MSLRFLSRQANMDHEIGAKDARDAARSTVDISVIALRTAKKKAERLGITVEELAVQEAEKLRLKQAEQLVAPVAGPSSLAI